jgi:protein SCO1/2
MLRKILVYVCLSALMAFSQAPADNGSHDQHQAMPKKQEAGTLSNMVQLKVPDLELLNQDGEKGRFVSDFIGDRLAAITFTYTTCTTACPVLDGIFLKVQDKIADQLGKEISLITLSIDPVTDIPQRLKAHTQKIKAQPGWNFLTGKKEAVNRILKALEVYSPDIFNHPPTVYIVDGQQNVWSRINGFPFSAKVVKVMDEFRTARAARAQK